MMPARQPALLTSLRPLAIAEIELHPDEKHRFNRVPDQILKAPGEPLITRQAAHRPA
jgi:hypothetical protein